MNAHARDSLDSAGDHPLDSTTPSARPSRALRRWLTAAVALSLVAGPGAATAMAAPVSPSAPPGSSAAGVPGTTPAAPVTATPVAPVQGTVTSTAPGTTLPAQATPLTAAERATTVRTDIDLEALTKEQGTNGASLGQGQKVRASGVQVQARATSGATTSSSNTAGTVGGRWVPDGGVLGMDVSGWQPSVNWSSAWSAGSRFAYVKASEGNFQSNDYFNQQYNGSAAVGMIRGAYHFALPGLSSGASQANLFVNNGGGWSGDGKTLPPLLDVEYNPYPSLGNMCFNLSPAQMVSWIRDFSNTIKARTGRVPAIYTTTNWWETCTGSSRAFGENPLHLAAYSTWVGPMPSSWSTYSIWQFNDDRGPFPGDSNQWNGSYAQLQSFARGAVASVAAPAKPAPVTPAPVTGPSIKSPADVVAADSAGVLWNYPAKGQSTLGARYQIGSGWKSARSVTVIDWNNDGYLDLLAQWRAGNVTVYTGKSTGGFNTPRTLFTGGMAGAQLTVGYWIAASAYPQILSRNANGTVTLWKYVNGGYVVNAGTIGKGWAGMDMTMVDFDGDGYQDILARRSNGTLALYRSDGSGSFRNESRQVVGRGWNVMTSVSVASNFASSGSVGLIARVRDGNLRYYPLLGKRTWGATQAVGWGWNGFAIAGGETIRAW